MLVSGHDFSRAGLRRLCRNPKPNFVVQQTVGIATDPAAERRHPAATQSLQASVKPFTSLTTSFSPRGTSVSDFFSSGRFAAVD